LKLQGTAIEKEGMTSFSHARDELIHDSDAGAYKSILSLAAEFGDFGKWQLSLTLTHEGKGRSDLDGRGGTESRADWDFTVHQQIRSLQLETAPLKDTGNTDYVVTPSAGTAFGQVVKIKLEIAGEFFGVDDELTIWTRGDRYIGREPDSCRHDEAVVVIGVFADQVHASGCAKNPRTIAE
jgi:hypothetical protein